jgi:hypothetical protein
VDQRLLLMHQAMLGDQTRLRAFGAALRSTVTPGATVADVGAGTLVLSMLALDAGAGHVFAVEADPEMLAVAAALIHANDLGSRITLVAADAASVVLPRKVDVVVGELLGNLGPEEDSDAILGAFAARNLLPGGVVVPQEVQTRLAAVEIGAEGWGVWSRLLGYDLSPVLDLAEDRAHLHFFQQPPRELAVPVPVGLDRVARCFDPVELRMTQHGTLHAVVGYFVARLDDSTTLSNFPPYPGCNWAPWVWPLRHTQVAPGDVLHAQLQPGTDWRDVSGWSLKCQLRRA